MRTKLARPVMIAWEFTTMCNLRCGHCGSSCDTARGDELNPAEALAVCDQIIDMAPDWVSLTGGEFFARPDWDAVVERLCTAGLTVSIVTNGTLLDKETVARLKACGGDKVKVNVSIDGPREFHDSLRGAGSFDKAISGIGHLLAAGIPTAGISTIMKGNLALLPALAELLQDAGIYHLQIQLCVPMGQAADESHAMLEPSDIQTLIDFAYEQTTAGELMVFLADNIGYFTKKESIIRHIAHHSEKLPVWSGCGAGLSHFCIMSNGDVAACTTLRDSSFVEGNIRTRLLRDIWADENSFHWNRNMRPEMLTGYCRGCRYAEKCLGGCSCMKQHTGSLYGENHYCVYHLAMTGRG